MLCPAPPSPGRYRQALQPSHAPLPVGRGVQSSPTFSHLSPGMFEFEFRLYCSRVETCDSGKPNGIKLVPTSKREREWHLAAPTEAELWPWTLALTTAIAELRDSQAALPLGEVNEFD